MRNEILGEAFRSGEPDASARPRPGSTATTQKRERDGRFRGSRAKRCRKKPGRGVIGPGWLKSKTKLERARMIVRLIRIRDRLFHESSGTLAPKEEATPDTRMKGIQELQKASVTATLAALHKIQKEYHKKRSPLPPPEQVAAELSVVLGRNISARTLYRVPYVTSWGGNIDYFGRAPEDEHPRANRFYRMTGPLQTAMIIDLREEIENLHRARREELVAQSQQEDWTAW